jgi:alkanesulfonate monooxygenase
MSEVRIRTTERKAEVAWFSALCSDDYRYLGVPDGELRSSFRHCSEIVQQADRLGYDNILLPSGWIAGQDALNWWHCGWARCGHRCWRER